MKSFSRENDRYIVVKRKHLSESQRQELDAVIAAHNVPTVKSVVVENDWPIYDDAWKLVQSLAEATTGHELLQEDLHNVMVKLPKDIREMMKKHAIMLGGGFIREVVAGNPPHDIDLLGPSVDRIKLAQSELLHGRGNQARVLNTKNAITMVQAPRTTVQFITRWLFGDPKKLIESFDFTVCQAVVYWDSEKRKWCSMVSPRFYQDLASKRLVYTAPVRKEDAGGSMLRMRKFLHRGYHISADNMGAIVARLTRNVDWHNPQTFGEEGARSVLIGLLREVDPLLVVDGVDPVDMEHSPLSEPAPVDTEDT